jgi:hypothetical protein
MALVYGCFEKGASLSAASGLVQLTVQERVFGYRFM